MVRRFGVSLLVDNQPGQSATFGMVQLGTPILRFHDPMVAHAAALTVGVTGRAATRVQPTVSRMGGALGPVLGG